jgi:tetratricopeptide (TPR) repeat protein
VSTVELAAAEALLSIGRAEEARRRLAALLAGEPHNVDALCLLARCHVHLDDQAAALTAATAAAAADPNRAEAHILRASALVALDRPDEGLEAADAALALDGDRPAAHLVRALALFNTFKRKEAWAALHEVTRLAPHWADAHAIEGSLHHTLGHHRRARRSYRRALLLRPDHTRAMEGLGHLALRRGRLGVAMRQFGAAAALSPTGQAAAAGVDSALTGLYGWAFIAAWLSVTLLTGATLTLGLPIGVYELTHPERPDNGERFVMGLLGGVCWLLLAGVVIVTIDVRQARRRAASPEESGSFGPDQHANIQTGRLTLRWFRATGVFAILPSFLAAQPAEPWTTRAPVGTAVLAALALYWPGEPPAPTAIGMFFGALVVVFHLFWLPIRALRAVVSTDRR